jgi:hypothetical protein
MYKKSIQDINYEKLKEQNIKCIMFDLDNTLLRVHKSIPRKDTVDLIKKLNKDFKVIIISNNTSESRLKTAADYLKVDYIKFAMKPFSRGFRKVKKMYNFSKDEMCLIGDQLMTDVLGGNRYGVFTILVDPLSNDELKVTGVNRFFEKRKLKKLDKKNLFKKGEYYE